jgi:hypothetical protein
MDIVERLRNTEFSFEPPMDAVYLMDEAANEIERLRKVNVMQARWLHEAQQEHKQDMDYVRKLLSVENAALKEGE